MGCGWLGLPLGEFLLERSFQVKGSTTRDAKIPILQNAGIQAHLIEVGENLEGARLNEFFNSDILYLNIPPGRRRPKVAEFYPKQVRRVVEEALKHGCRKIVFVSSTGVYANEGQEVTESTEVSPVRNSGLALVAAEQYIRSLAGVQWIILRMGGLVGGTRKAGRFLAGKKELPNGDALVNLVHLEDCVQISYELLRRNIWNEIYNIVADEHPTRAMFYTYQALKDNLEPPQFLAQSSSQYKIVSNRKVKRDLNYRFLHPDPMDF